MIGGLAVSEMVAATRPSIAWGAAVAAGRDADAHPYKYMGIVMRSLGIPLSAGAPWIGIPLAIVGEGMATADDTQHVRDK